MERARRASRVGPVEGEAHDALVGVFRDREKSRAGEVFAQCSDEVRGLDGLPLKLAQFSRREVQARQGGRGTDEQRTRLAGAKIQRERRARELPHLAERATAQFGRKLFNHRGEKVIVHREAVRRQLFVVSCPSLCVSGNLSKGKRSATKSKQRTTDHGQAPPKKKRLRAIDAEPEKSLREIV